MFRLFDDLRKFVIVAQHGSLSEAAEHLYLTKGALSHQIKRLEENLSFRLFDRSSKGIELTPKGRELLLSAHQSFYQMETKIDQLKEISDRSLTIGVSTYFASRWLSPRLMNFMQAYPKIRLRIQPMIDFANFAGAEVDLAIRWGAGHWKDCEIVELFNCPAWPAGNKDAFERIQQFGIEEAFANFTLLRDSEASNAWGEWYKRAGLQSERILDSLIIPDPNVRVQAVLDGQGVSLNDELIHPEIKNERLYRLSTVELADYGYFLAYQSSAIENPEVQAFIDWITGID